MCSSPYSGVLHVQLLEEPRENSYIECESGTWNGGRGRQRDFYMYATDVPAGDAVVTYRGESGEVLGETMIRMSDVKMESMKNNAVISGSDGKIELPDPWMPGREGGPYHAKIIITKNGNEEIIDVKGPEHLFFFEGELASQCIAKEKTQPPHPAMTWEDTLGNLQALDTWREKVNYKLPQDEI